MYRPLNICKIIDKLTDFFYTQLPKKDFHLYSVNRIKHHSQKNITEPHKKKNFFLVNTQNLIINPC